ncbi:hypothetical protein [Micromonospora sp. b486]|uniref:hypothetical protein n=1 Tax=Micromonospora sp. b486 TaxID=3053986 RepID=UPI00338E240E
MDFGLLFDPLAAVFVLLITGVGFLIHLYAVEYMAHDAGGGCSSRTSTCSSPPCSCWCSATTT